MKTAITINIDINFKLPDFVDFVLKNYEEDNLIGSVQWSIEDIIEGVSNNISIEDLTEESIIEEIISYLCDLIQDDDETILFGYIKSITPIFQSLDVDNILSAEPDDRFYTYDELETELESRDWSKLILKIKEEMLEDAIQTVQVLRTNLK